MKKLIPLLMLLQAHAIGPTEFSVNLPKGFASVKPSSPVTLDLVVRGCDTVNATVNGTSLGVLNAPYRITFTSQPTGDNTIVVVACNDRGATTTTTLIIPSASVARYYSKKLYR